MKLTHLVRAFLLSLCLLDVEAYGQYWMQRGGSLNLDEALDVVVDNNGNTYATGYFTGSASFGATTLTSSGSSDIFVVKINSTGTYQWAVKAGGNGTDRGLAIALDDSANVVITGFFNATAAFGATSLVAAGQQDIFVAKYNTAGALQWAKRAGGTDADIGSGVAVDPSNNIVITGEFKGSSTFGASTLTSQNGSTDVYISKIAPGGTFLWTQQGAGNQTDRGVDVDCDGSGNIYAIGQFSDTFSFDQTHNNTMFNVVYLAKFNPAGVEQWFKVMGSSTSGFAYDIDVNNAGNSFITGDFVGTMTFFGPPNTNLTTAFDNGIFVARYTAAGALQWASASGSDNAVVSRGIAADAQGNTYITGHFECTMTEYSEEYGESTFNNIGYSDVFVTKFASNGNFSWSRQFGGKQEDYAYGIDVNGFGQPVVAGSFKTTLSIPTSGNFLSANLAQWNNLSCNQSNGYCNDPNYGQFHGMISTGNSDAFIANCIDPARKPYDYYLRSGSGCDLTPLSVCINSNCVDTLSSCGNVIANSNPNTCPGAGPLYDYLWSNGSNISQAAYTSSGNKWHLIETKDNCYSSSDTFYVQINPPPPVPWIEDDVVINTPTPLPQKVDVCLPDTVLLTGSNYTVDSILWLGPGLPAGGVSAPSISVTESGFYTFFVYDENGCFNYSIVEVEFFQPLDSFALRAMVEDTVYVCENENVHIILYDSISNPLGQSICFTTYPPYVETTFTYTPASWVTTEDCETELLVVPSDTGWFYFEAMVILRIPCDTDTHYVSDSLYIVPYPAPEPPSINVMMNGSSYYCPGSTCLQYGTGGGAAYTWMGPSNNNVVADSVYIGVTGWYTVSSIVYDTNQYGCTDSTSGSFLKYISQKPQPLLSSSSTVICPNDVVWLVLTNTGAYGGFNWEGPSGPIPGDTNAIAVSEPGTYYCIVNDEDSCDLSSNTLLLTQYTTPSLAAGGDLVICDGDSVVLSVVSNAGSEIEWLPPLSGSGTEITVYSPGVYTCKITSCGIETYATMEVFPSYVASEITYEGVLCLDSFMVLHGSDSMHTYQWNQNNTGTDSIIITQPGTYILTTTDTNGCQKVSDPVVITIDQDPAAITIEGHPVLCEFDTMTLYGNPNMAVYRWSTGDTTQNTLITDNGLYSLWAKDSNGCRGRSAPIKITTPDTIARYDVTGDLEFCEGDSVSIRARRGGLASYLWLPDSVYGRTVFFDTTGVFSLFTTDTFGCTAWSEDIAVYMQPNEIEKPLVEDTLICEYDVAELLAEVNIGTLKWSERVYGPVINEGSYFQTPTLIEPMVYYVWSDFELCRGDTSAVKVATMDCYNALIPNIFTPNGDGSNDFFTIVLNEIQCFHLYIYNRWGVLLHETHTIGDGWNGTVQRTGKEAPEGTYYYLVEYCRHNGSEEKLTGFVTLIRQ